MHNFINFYDFLDTLERKGNTNLLESIKDGFSVLFETATVVQTLKNREKKHPFHSYEQKYVKKLIKDFMEIEDYHFPESGDTRKPYEHLVDVNNFDIILNWAVWQVIDDVEVNTKDILEKIEELVKKIKNADPDQLDMFGYTAEEKIKLIPQLIETESLNFLKANEATYLKQINKLLFEMPQDIISNPEDAGRHGGDMAGWSNNEWEAYQQDKYSGNYPFSDEMMEAWTNFLYKACDNNELLKHFKDPNYNDSMAMRDADRLNDENYEKTIDGINIEIGREKYEEAEAIIEMDNNFVWVDSSKKSCSAEAKQMGHCGNEHGPDVEPHDTLWSLRQGTSPREWISHITVIINGEDIVKGKNIVKQFKGNGPKTGNAKPSEKYHPYIMKLLTSKDPRTNNWIVDGFYGEEYHGSNKNFFISDLSEENQKLLKNIRPDLFEKTERKVERVYS